ncbi:biotin carboxylase N-terminal domain-containing protein [Sorangium sp. So ce1000]|uniref:biotin carboxylase N-terminal domain-containing protein n=1 Tax=Sorangium sp. So ce1000 TaxID=3133325 RepID=UPI003F5D87F4
MGEGRLVIRKVLIAAAAAAPSGSSDRRMRLQGVAVHCDMDRGSLHVRLADESYAIDPAPAAESYLRIDRMLEVPRRSGSDAIPPGTPSFSENREVAEACQRAGIACIGPPSSATAASGSKPAARTRMAAASVSIFPFPFPAFPSFPRQRALARAAHGQGRRARRAHGRAAHCHMA